MTATAEQIQKEFAILSRDEKEALFINLFQALQVEQAAEWPLASAEASVLRESLAETKKDFEAGKGIPHEEIVREFAPWRRPAK